MADDTVRFLVEDEGSHATKEVGRSSAQGASPALRGRRFLAVLLVPGEITNASAADTISAVVEEPQ